MRFKYKIVITGGNGRFGSVLKKKYHSDKLLYPNKKQLNILSTKSIENYLIKKKTKDFNTSCRFISTYENS